MDHNDILKLIPPRSFSHHNARIVRGRYPDSRGINFITGLGIRKFVSLGPGFPGDAERALGKVNKIELTHYPMVLGEVGEYQSQLEHQLTDVIDYIITKNPESKIYVYDDDGHTLVGIVCGILRRIEGWDTISAIAEYSMFSPVGVFNSDAASLISTFNITRWL